jgi:hypothetical protein
MKMLPFGTGPEVPRLGAKALNTVSEGSVGRSWQRDGQRTATVWGNCLGGVGLPIDFNSPSNFSFIGHYVLRNLAESQVTTSDSEFRDGVGTPKADNDVLWQSEVGLSWSLDSSALDTRDASAQQPIASDGRLLNRYWLMQIMTVSIAYQGVSGQAILALY